MIHPLAGVLSAYGMGLADMVELRQRSVGGEALEEVLAELAGEAEAALKGQGVEEVALKRRAALRYEGSDSSLEVEAGAFEAMREAFEEAHRVRFGFTSPETAVVVETAIVEAVGNSSPSLLGEGDRAKRGGGESFGLPNCPSTRLRLVPLPEASAGRILLRPRPPRSRHSHPRPRPDHRPLRHHRRRARLEGRGRSARQPHPHPLRPRAKPPTPSAPTPIRSCSRCSTICSWRSPRRWASRSRTRPRSVNIKERLDFSCALFDSGGALIANAPHIPVHLGSMGDSIRTIIEARGERRDGRGIRPGDVYVLNAPYRGGTHLPDITVIMPVFAADGDEAPAWYVAARGHHADIGGIAPGSMPPDSRHHPRRGGADRQCAAGRRGALPRGRDPRPARLGPVAGAPAGPQHLRPQGPGRRLRARRRRDAAGGGRIWPRRRRRLHGPRPGQCRGSGPAADRPPLATATSATRWTMAPRSASASGSTRRAARRSSTSPAPAPSSRTISTRPTRSAGRRRSTSSGPWSTTDPDERRLPEADHARRPGRLDAQPALSGRRRRRQCRDQPGDHRRFVRRLPGAGAEPGDDEQFHLRQRAPPIL